MVSEEKEGTHLPLRALQWAEACLWCSLLSYILSGEVILVLEDFINEPPHSALCATEALVPPSLFAIAKLCHVGAGTWRGAGMAELRASHPQQCQWQHESSA